MGTCSTSSFIHGDPNTGLTLAQQGLYQWSLFLSPRDFFFLLKEKKMNSFCLAPCTPVSKTGISSLTVEMGVQTVPPAYTTSPLA